MKRFYTIFISLSILLANCSKDEVNHQKESDAFNDMLAFYSDIKDQTAETLSMAGGSFQNTRVEHLDMPDINTEEVAILLQFYMEQYFSFENIDTWNEKEVLDRITNEQNLTSEQKEILIAGVAHVYYLKHDILPLFSSVDISTRATAKGCLAAFNKSVVRITRNFIIWGTFGLLTGGIGTGVAAINAYIAIDEAESDYNNCMKTAQ